LFQYLGDEDVLEIFSRDYFQVFRNLQFFKVYQGSVFDLLVLDWMTLFKRQTSLEERIFLMMEESFRGPLAIRDFSNVLPHRAFQRTGSFPGASYFVEHRFRSSLKGRGSRLHRSVGLLVSSRWRRSSSLSQKVS
jgi:hypothetical protein